MEFKDILSAGLAQQEAVLEWRNHINVRKNMYTDAIISKENHETWINNLRVSEVSKVYIAYKSHKAIGVISISNISLLHKSAEWAFYLNPEYIGSKGLGILMEYHFLNYIFSRFDVEKLNCEVLEINPSVIKLHKKFGFLEEGIRRSNVIKNNMRVDVCILGILKEEWLQTKGKFLKIIERLERL
ncbi:MAG: UDP-4-amino-4,6-dideoxy-N-acetyl-beta-L-altrosamine N-acetyltransferase [Mariprofundaceae bacterium]|nr:UDP-4-amino-4,6-dideoxy-N-acetyl-beta-L-altrosamine N-acetyltransferase [Mariprofundaceae bacterium]